MIFDMNWVFILYIWPCITTNDLYEVTFLQYFHVERKLFGRISEVKRPMLLPHAVTSQ